MKKADIDRLREICEKEGFELDTLYGTHWIVKKKKDPWDGVEFVENTYKGGIKKVNFISGINIHLTTGKILLMENAKPSTESDYVDQLKKECFERYGEIKYGDKFQSDWCDIKPIKTIGHGSYEFSYLKNTDNLLFNGVSIYSSGKWAKKLPERVEVEFNKESGFWDDHSSVEFEFSLNRNYKDLNFEGAGEHLAKQLESYLNNEV